MNSEKYVVNGKYIFACFMMVAGSLPSEEASFCDLYCTFAYASGAQGYCPIKDGGNGQSIGSTVSNAIIRSWLWSTVTESCPLGSFSSITASS